MSYENPLHSLQIGSVEKLRNLIFSAVSSGSTVDEAALEAIENQELTDHEVSIFRFLTGPIDRLHPTELHKVLDSLEIRIQELADRNLQKRNYSIDF